MAGCMKATLCHRGTLKGEGTGEKMVPFLDRSFQSLDSEFVIGFHECSLMRRIGGGCAVG